MNPSRQFARAWRRGNAAWLISILGFGSLAGRLMLGHVADRLGRQRILGRLHVALGLLFSYLDR